MKWAARGHSPGVAMQTGGAVTTSRRRPAEAAGGLDFARVYDEHFDFVWRCLRRMGVPDSNMDDAAQDVFLVVHRQLAGFAGRSALRTWLFGIVLRVVSDHRRRHRRKEAGLTELPAELADPAHAGALDAAEKREAARLLDALLDGMEEDKRAVFVLAEMEQMTANEIAEALAVNVNTVYSRLRTARMEFERALARLQARPGWR